MDSLLGLDLDSWRVLTVMGTLAALCLYAYRIKCLISLMRAQSEKVLYYNRIVYAALIVFLPLGLGGWIYDYVVNEKKYSRLFLYPFCIVTLVYIYSMFHILPKATQFNFDYISW